MKIQKITAVIVSCAWALTGCLNAEDSDLTDFINETKRRPKGEIEPIPSFIPYEAFVYEAQRLRDPFERPVSELQHLVLGGGSAVQPDLSRPREILEEFNFAELSMKGTYQRDGTLWALVNDGRGEIQWVREGNYMGKNHGKIMSISQNQISVIEIVSDGIDGWIQRPQSLRLEEKE